MSSELNKNGSLYLDTLYIFIEYRCDGIIDCIYGEDEDGCWNEYTTDTHEKKYFSSEATIKCQENRIDVPDTTDPKSPKEWPMIWYLFTHIYFTINSCKSKYLYRMYSVERKS